MVALDELISHARRLSQLLPGEERDAATQELRSTLLFQLVAASDEELIGQAEDLAQIILQLDQDSDERILQQSVEGPRPGSVRSIDEP